jgi:hypothetical protein
MSANEYFLKYHQNFNKDSTLWRYMDLQKFLMLLHTSSLWLSRADHFDDTFEGSISEETNRVLKYSSDVTPEMRENFGKISDMWKQWTFVSCWHMSENENALMWSAYAKNGLAVKTKFSKLSLQLPEQAFLSPVLYKDYDSELVPIGTQIQYYVKRHHFSDEREVRALIVDPPFNISYGEYEAPPPNSEAGRAISINVDLLLDAVVIRPFATDQEYEMLQRVIELAGSSVPIVRSKLDGKPITR